MNKTKSKVAKGEKGSGAEHAPLPNYKIAWAKVTQPEPEVVNGMLTLEINYNSFPVFTNNGTLVFNLSNAEMWATCQAAEKSALGEVLRARSEAAVGDAIAKRLTGSFDDLTVVDWVDFSRLVLEVAEEMDLKQAA